MSFRHRSKVIWKRELLKVSNFINCFGKCSLLRGHNLLPTPPASIIAFIVSLFLNFVMINILRDIILIITSW